MSENQDIKKLGLQATLITGESLQSVRLTGTPNGKYLFDHISENEGYIYIEGQNGRWYARCDMEAYFMKVPAEQIRCYEIFDGCMLYIYADGRVYTLYVQEISADLCVFKNYIAAQCDRLELKIGRTPENDICYPNKFVSREHALLIYRRGQWQIYDLESKNHVYVNGRCVSNTELNPGDEIYIMELRIVIGYGYLSMNHHAAVNPVKLKDARRYDADKEYASEESRPEEILFNRFPRRRLSMNVRELTIEAPPMSMNDSNMPMLLRMGSSFVMGGTAVMMGNLTMLLSSLMFPFLKQRFSDKERKAYEEKRVTRYTRYLREKEQEIAEEIEWEEAMLNEKFPCLSRILEYPMDSYLLWERGKNDDDFLVIRVGSGSRRLLAEIKYPQQRFNLDDDELEEQMYRLAGQPYELRNVPVVYSMTEYYICGVLGTRSLELAFIRMMMMQLSILYGYDELKIVFLAQKKELEQLEFVRFLPHIWNDQGTIRFLAVDPMETYSISEVLKHDLEEQPGQRNEWKDMIKRRPYYVVFALDKKIFDSIEILKEMMQADCNQGVSIVAVFDDLPKECQMIFRLDNRGRHLMVPVKQTEDEERQFCLDDFEKKKAHTAMRVVANTKLKIVSQTYALPKMITFLEMYGVGRIEHLNPMKRWTENNPVNSLAVPVGVTADGNLFELDLHEKFQGPHGLVAGMTGSGKSEFIITFILSMAVNFHPDEVAFVLIDYKGGGLAGAFDDEQRGIHLPHLVGTITNLDGAAIQRSLMSIQSELKRRQRIFNDAKSKTDEGTMDIYTYQKLYREKKVTEPLPHLFVISDEFAELKQQEPEFMEQLISAARIGRSLGVHLILATQKPAGVVNDQIRSNSKFQVCLKVQSKADSMDMLKRPDAAQLKDTGRFYLQIGYNEFFALGQSAWCGADYEPQDKAAVKREESVCVLDASGQTVFEAAKEGKRGKAQTKQLVAIVRMLSALAQQEKIRPRLLWQKALADQISLQYINEAYPLRQKNSISIPLGVVDNPASQRQFAYVLDLQKCQNVLAAGESGSGKSMLLQTILTSIVLSYSPEDVHFYTMDFSGKMLKIFQQLPHCGGYLDEESEKDIPRLLDMIGKIIAERKKRFADAEVSNFDSYLQIKKIPLILILIDHFSGLLGLKKGDEFYRRISVLMRDGVSYGIKFIITAVNPNDFNIRIKQNASERLALQLTDRYAYGAVLDCICRYTPPKKSGRGLCLVNEVPLEFQAAMYGAGMEEQKRMARLKEELSRIQTKYADMACAERLLQVTENERYQDFCRDFPTGRIPLGYLVTDVKKVAMPLKQLTAVSMYFGNPLGIAPVLDNFFYATAREHMRVIVIPKRNGSILKQDKTGRLDSPHIEWMECSDHTDRVLRDRLYAQMNHGAQIGMRFCEEHGIPAPKEERDERQADAVKRFLAENLEPVVVLFEDMAEFCSGIDSELMTDYGTMFSCFRGFQVFFIGCYYPGGTVSASRENVHSMFNQDQFILLFGGQYHKQKLASLPRDLKKEEMLMKYNLFLMRYRADWYAMSMPCGELRTDMGDEDLRSIV